MSGFRFMLSNGVISHSSETPSVSTFLQSHPGAYTTARTHGNASCLLFWERHLERLANSATILFNSNPELVLGSSKSLHFLASLPVPSLPKWKSTLSSLVNSSMTELLPVVLKEKSNGEELAVTALVTASMENLNKPLDVGDCDVFKLLNVHVHIGNYVPAAFGTFDNAAHLAMVGRGRDVAAAKYSNWVRLRQSLEKRRPPSATELLLSNDGNHILEGCITNFFAVCHKESDELEPDYLHDNDRARSLEVQTAPVSDGVLPGIIRQLVIEACLSMGIPVREVAPSWTEHSLWQEAFVTIIHMDTPGCPIGYCFALMPAFARHVKTIRVPTCWEALESKCSEVSWEEKVFEGPGIITKAIQEEIMRRASVEGYPLTKLV